MTKKNPAKNTDHLPRRSVPRRMDPEVKGERIDRIQSILETVDPELLEECDAQDLYDQICLKEITPHEFAQGLESLRSVLQKMPTE